MKIKIKDIKVDSRFRDDYGDIESLSVSIQRYGLLHPIVLGEGNILVAGERRLKAHEILGKEEIELEIEEDQYSSYANTTSKGIAERFHKLVNDKLKEEK